MRKESIEKAEATPAETPEDKESIEKTEKKERFEKMLITPPILFFAREKEDGAKTFEELGGEFKELEEYLKKNVIGFNAWAGTMLREEIQKERFMEEKGWEKWRKKERDKAAKEGRLYDWKGGIPGDYQRK